MSPWAVVAIVAVGSWIAGVLSLAIFLRLLSVDAAGWWKRMAERRAYLKRWDQREQDCPYLGKGVGDRR